MVGVFNVMSVLFSFIAVPLLVCFALWMGNAGIQGLIDRDLRRECGWNVIIPMSIGCILSAMLAVALIGMLAGHAIAALAALG